MMMCNESMRKWLNPSGDFNFGVYLLSGCVSGAFAAALTTPLDVVKTALQTQGLRAPTAESGLSGEAPKHFEVRYKNAREAVRAIYQAHGLRGFIWGMRPRMLQVGPSCAISWCAYESMKHTLDRLGIGRVS